MILHRFIFGAKMLREKLKRDSIIGGNYKIDLEINIL
jgi:hypothetical protein